MVVGILLVLKEVDMVYIWKGYRDFRVGWEFKTYEEALEKGLWEALKLI